MIKSQESSESQRSQRSHKIFFVGGGTAGHAQPNIAIINQLKKISEKEKISLDLFYIGRRGGIEKEIAKKHGLAYRGIFSGKLRRYWDWRNFTDIFLIILGFFQSLFILVLNRPGFIFAKGGFVTVPFCLAASVLKIPFAIHESDSVFGLSNRILIRWAKKVYLGFPEEVYKLKFPEGKVSFTGNPVREDFYGVYQNRNDFLKKYHLNPKNKIILVSGGSQGAQAINMILKKTIEKITEIYSLIHITGRVEEKDFKIFREKLSRKEKDNYLVFGFVAEEMPEFMKNADLIISRTGANSITEISVVGKPAIFIPLPSSASDHQRINAAFLKNHDAGIILEENKINPQKLIFEIDSILSNKKTQEKLAKNIKELFPKNSAEIIARSILSLL